MIALSHKSKQYGLIAIKLLLLSLTAAYLVDRLSDVELHQWHRIGTLWLSTEALSVTAILILSFLNIFMEIGKWRSLVGILFKISWKTAAYQHLSATALSLATPARLAEYGAKAMYFRPGDRKKAVGLNLWSNGSQLAITLCFGLFGLYIMNEHLITALGISISVGRLVIFVPLITIACWGIYRWISSAQSNSTILSLPSVVRAKVLLLSTGRYLCFSLQLVLLLVAFGAKAPWWDLWVMSWAMYLLSSALPLGLLFDLAVKGAISTLLFSLLGVDEWTVFAAVLCGWLFNTLLPAVLGGLLVFRPKLTRP